MTTSLAMLLLLIATGAYTLFQRSSLRRTLLGRKVSEEWFRGVFGTGAGFSLALVMNAVSYMKLKGTEFEIAMAEGIALPDGTYAEPSSSILLTGQLEILVGTFSLLILLWEAIKKQSSALSSFDRKGHVQVMHSVVRSLLLPFWLATFGVGSVFGVSAGFGLRDIVRHVELLFGPPLILSVELTIIWLVLRIILKHEESER
jgi:hypothetical protein